jgi:hypothetical protein
VDLLFRVKTLLMNTLPKLLSKIVSLIVMKSVFILVFLFLVTSCSKWELGLFESPEAFKKEYMTLYPEGIKIKTTNGEMFYPGGTKVVVFYMAHHSVEHVYFLSESRIQKTATVLEDTWISGNVIVVGGEATFMTCLEKGTVLSGIEKIPDEHDQNYVGYAHKYFEK